MSITSQINTIKETLSKPRIKVRQLRKGLYRVNYNNKITYVKNEN